MLGFDDSITATPVELTGRLAEFRDALNAEIDTIKRTSLSSLVIRNGQRISDEGKGFLYRFHVEYSSSIPADTPCTLIFDKNRYDVTVVNYEETFITILTKNDLGDMIPKAQLENGSIVLMKKLIDRIEQNAEKDNPAGIRMFGESSYETIAEEPTLAKNNLNEQQLRAVKSAVTRNITYIWGPPGTGKTTVISNIIEELYKQKRTVLLVSHTNTAVDGAMRHVCKKLKDDNATIKGIGFPALRIGTLIDSHLASDYEEVTFDDHLKTLSAELVETRDILEKEKERCKRDLRNWEHRRISYRWMLSWQENRTVFLAQYEKLKQYELRTKKLCDAIARQQKKAENAKNALDSCADYFVALQAWQNSKNGLDNGTSEHARITAQVADLLQKIENRQNAIVQHQRYTELSQKLQGRLSLTAQQKQFDAMGQETKVLSNQLNSLGRQIGECQDALVKSQAKSVIGRMFSGMDSPAKIQAHIEQLKTMLQHTAENHTIKQRLLEQYHNELLETKTLMAERSEIHLVSSPDRLRTEIDVLKRKNASAHAAIDRLKSECCEARSALTEAKKHLDFIRSSLSVNPETVRSEFDAAEGIITDLKQKRDDTGHAIASIEAELDKFIAEYQYISDKPNGGMAYPNNLELMDAAYSDLRHKFIGITLDSIDKGIERLNAEIKTILMQITEINNQIGELSVQIIARVPIVGTTLSKTYLEDAIQNRSFDTVILDEASMASIPALWCAAYLAEKNIVIAGDFRQLAPIVISDDETAKKWLGKDIFNHAGLTNAKIARPVYFIALQQQFRMEKDIADISSRLYYNESPLKTIREPEGKEEFQRWYGGSNKSSCINILDTKELHAWVTGIPQGKGKTRLNHLSAILCVDLAFTLTEKLIAENRYQETHVLILSPYRAHTNRVRQLIEHECKMRSIPPDKFALIRAGTVHSFQGSEADIVIFDLVVDEPHWSNNLFMANQEVDDDLRRMFNVAITRAKYKLFIVGNIDWCRKRAKNNALGQLLKELIDRHVPNYDAKKEFPHLTYVKPGSSISTDELSGKRLICTQENYYDFFLNDVRDAKDKIIIYSPFMAKNRLSQVLPALQSAVNRGVKIYIVTKPYSDFNTLEQSSKRECERILSDSSIGIIHKRKMHEKLVFIDSSILWTGSLNTLSFSDTQEVMERRQDEIVFADYAQQMNIESLAGIHNDTKNQVCPVCGNEMLAAESDSGGIYWTCSICDYARNSDEPYPIDGELFCPKCGIRISFKMVNEPRWVCENHHYRKVRRSDLMLPKMRAKIPENQLVKVVVSLGGKHPKSGVEREILKVSVIRSFDDKGHLIAGFNTMQEAADFAEVSASSISKAIYGERKTAGGYQWRRYQAGMNAEDISPLS